MLHSSTTCTLIYCHFECMTRMFQMYSSEATIHRRRSKRLGCITPRACGFTGMTMSYVRCNWQSSTDYFIGRAHCLGCRPSRIFWRVYWFIGETAETRLHAASQPLHSQERRVTSLQYCILIIRIRLNT
jgi:hypothetical protein